MKKLVELNNIYKKYSKNNVLKGVSFTIYEGDRIGIIGGNGSGKSTMVEIIAKVREATSGHIYYDKNIILGLQFQESKYPIGVSVKSIINFNLNRYKSILSREKVMKMLKTFHLEKLYKKDIITMSGGEQQRLNILLSIIHNPNFLILDELSTGLDIKVKRELRDYILQYLHNNPKTSVILISHSMPEVEELSNRVIVLNNGIIDYDFKMAEILKKYKSVEKFANYIFEEIYAESEV